MSALLFWILVGIGVLLGLLALLALIGLFLPKSHVVSRSLKLTQTPETIWQVIADFPGEPAWHKGVEKVERMPDRDGREVWRETFSGGYPMQLEIVEAVAPRRLVRAIADERGPFSGRWEFDIAPRETGSRVTIVEYGEIANPFFRFMARLFMKPAIYLEIYLSALAEKFGEPAAIE